MKQRILFILPNFEIGGTVVSTKNILSLLDDKKYDIYILPLAGSLGSLRNMYSSYNIIKSSAVLRFLAASTYKNFGVLSMVAAAVRFISKLNIIKSLLLSLSSYKYSRCNIDIVIACQEGISSQFASFVKAKKRLAWVRCDYKRYFEERKINELHIYNKFHKIICVSQGCTQNFVTIYPSLYERTICLHNPQDSTFLLSQAKNNDHDPLFKNDEFTIVSVGRFSPIKRFDLIPKIARYLLDNGISFRWYLIGGGSPSILSQIKDLIVKENVIDHVFCLGIKSNPLFYIKESDMLVCLSESEACPRVINEAKILHTPIVCNNFDTAKEYISDRVDGIIAPLDTIHIEISNLIKNKGLYTQIKKQISDFSFDNTEIISVLNQLLNTNIY